MYGATAAYIAPIVASAAGSIPTLAEVKRHDNAPYLLLLALLWYETITSARLDVDPAAQAAAANLATLLGPLAIYLALHVAPVLFAPTSPIPESWSIKQRGRAAFQQYLGTQDKQLAALSFGITLELLNGVILLVRLITGSYGTSFLLLMGYRHFLSWRYSNPLFVQVTASLVQQLDTYVHTAAWMPAFLRRLYYALKAALDPTISIVQALKNGASALVASTTRTQGLLCACGCDHPPDLPGTLSRRSTRRGTRRDRRRRLRPLRTLNGTTLGPELIKVVLVAQEVIAVRRLVGLLVQWCRTLDADAAAHVVATPKDLPTVLQTTTDSKDGHGASSTPCGRVLNGERGKAEGKEFVAMAIK
eukprot:CAMPEP_0170742770 /NCGR_PEP_ID=MMETSP0437-20130122/6916_1 /TAXON_ID=0 /ORGANISM="Sexangularia sp." /LENGTH=360 /DNA_ID=CAMNT_0011081403 /DNA_START=300 /DNA_END=1384 /DNA_ORIENTATION=-